MAIRTGWNWCPKCKHALVPFEEEGEPYQRCGNPGCRFIDYNNPIPVVALFIPHEQGLVLVKRGVEPFTGRWCLPRGYLKSNANPKGHAGEEGLQETGLILRLWRLLTACNPSPANFPLNQVTMFFLATAVGGVLRAGSDATDVGVFTPDQLPDICFGTDTQLIRDWYAGVYGTIDQPLNFRLPDGWLLQALAASGS